MQGLQCPHSCSNGGGSSSGGSSSGGGGTGSSDGGSSSRSSYSGRHLCCNGVKDSWPYMLVITTLVMASKMFGRRM
jgi:hypothetical protein